MKKYVLILVIALFAITTLLSAQKGNTGKKQCCKMSQGSCKMDSAKCSMMTNGKMSDGNNMSCNKKCMKMCKDNKAMCMNSGMAKCDTAMCNKNAANHKGMKNCPMQK